MGNLEKNIAKILELALIGALIGISIRGPWALIGSLGIILYCRLLLFEKVSLGQAFVLGFVANLFSTSWAPEVFAHYSDQPLWIAVLFSAVIFSYEALKFVIAQVILNYSILKYPIRDYPGSSSPLSRMILFPGAWALAALIFPTLAPWNLSTTFIEIAPIALLARIGGPVFVDIFLIFLAGSLLTYFAERKIKGWLNPVLVIPACLALLSLANWASSNSKLNTEIKAAESISISAIQPNLIVEYDYSAPRVKVRNQRLKKLTSSALKAHPETDLVVWTETAWGYIFWEDETGIKKHGRRDPIAGHKQNLLFGHYTRIEPKSEREEALKKRPVYYNSASLLAADGSFSGKYRKKNLFPFGEKAPLDFLEKYFENSKYSLVEGHSRGTVTLEGTNIGVGICFEDLFPEIFRKAVQEENASLLISLTNGGWFNETWASQQHRDGARWRAVENGRYLLRAANEGPASLVDPWGEIQILTPEGTETFVHLPQVKLLEARTLYSSWGKMPAWVAIILIVLISLRSRVSLHVSQSPQ